jgi:glutamate racemase
MSERSGGRDAVLGVVDWGIGGLDFYRKVAVQAPDLPILYYSDAGFEPYGKLERRALAARLDIILDRLVDDGATHLVIACNAASTALPDLRKHDVPITGVITPAITAIQSQTLAHEVIVLGGQRTIDSNAYGAIANRKVLQRVAQPLSALVERGVVRGPEVDRTVGQVTKGLPHRRTLVVACTHYTALMPALKKALDPSHIVDPSAETVRHVLEQWRPSGAPRVPHRFVTSGDPRQMRYAARRAFNLVIRPTRQAA